MFPVFIYIKIVCDINSGGSVVSGSGLEKQYYYGYVSERISLFFSFPNFN